MTVLNIFRKLFSIFCGGGHSSAGTSSDENKYDTETGASLSVDNEFERGAAWKKLEPGYTEKYFRHAVVKNLWFGHFTKPLSDEEKVFLCPTCSQSPHFLTSVFIWLPGLFDDCA